MSPIIKFSENKTFKSFVCGFASVVIFVLILGALGIFFLTKSFNNQQSIAAERYSLVITKEIDLYSAEARRFLLIASRLHATSGTTENCQTKLSEIYDGTAIFSNLFVADKNGQIICDARSIASGKSISDRVYFQEVLANKNFVFAGFLISRFSNERTMTFAYPVLDSTGEVEKVFVTGVRIDQLEKDLVEIKLTDGFSAEVIDSNGLLMADAPATNSTGTVYDNDALLQFALSNNSKPVKFISSKFVSSIAWANDSKSLIVVNAPVRNFSSTLLHILAKYWYVILASLLAALVIKFLLSSLFRSKTKQ